MYAEYYGLQETPFSLTPDTAYLYMHGGQRDALDTLLIALDAGEGLLKVTGEVGTGKTLLCRKLLNSLGNEYCTAYLPDPSLPPEVLRRALAEELQIDCSLARDRHSLTRLLQERLIEFSRNGWRTVVCVDEAQTMPDASIEALRLLTNLETEKRKLLQIVLFGQPELDDKLDQPSLRQVRQRIAFSINLRPLNAEDVEGYVAHRMAVAGFQGRPVFSKRAVRALYRATGGVPRLINLICHKALILAYGKGDRSVSHHYVRQAACETEASLANRRVRLNWGLATALATGGALYCGSLQ